MHGSTTSATPAAGPRLAALRALRELGALRALGVLASGASLVAFAFAAPASAAAGDGWGWPLGGRPAVVRGFQPPPEPWLAGHRGADLLGSPGAAVRAAGAGEVAFAGTVAGKPVVVVSHSGGLRTTYEPVIAAVAVGADVSRGAVIGRLSGAGSHCTPRACLHWGLRRGETYLDPLALVGVTLRVRLLPVWGRSAAAGRASPGSASAWAGPPPNSGTWGLPPPASGTWGLPLPDSGTWGLPPPAPKTSGRLPVAPSTSVGLSPDTSVGPPPDTWAAARRGALNRARASPGPGAPAVSR